MINYTKNRIAYCPPPANTKSVLNYQLNNAERIVCRLAGLNFLLATTRAAIDRHQLTQFDLKLLRLVHLPFVVATATQGIALMLFLEGWLSKRDDLGHGNVSWSYNRVRCRAIFQDDWRLRLALALMATENSRSARQMFFTSAGLCQRPAPRPAR